MKLQNDSKNTKRKKAMDKKCNSKRVSNTDLKEGTHLLMLVNTSSFGKPFIEGSNSKLCNQSTEERTNKKEKRQPEELQFSGKAFDISLACNEKFECSNLKCSPTSNVVINISTIKEVSDYNVTMSNSSSYQENHFLNALQNCSISQNLMNKFKKIESCSIDFDKIYDLNQNMLMLEEHYFINRLPNPQICKQKYINAQMRTILLNWIMEVSAQLGFKRETYHLTVFLIDMFLQNYENLQTNEFQLLGVTCLMISSKFEEIFIPRVETFSHLTEDAYPTSLIVNWEHNVLRTLKWRVTYNTLATWSNILLLKWDDYVPLCQNDSSNLEYPFINELPFFRKQVEESYLLFRNFYQVLDLITLNASSSRYKDRFIVLAVMYLNIGLFIKAFSLDSVARDFPLHSEVLSNFCDYNLIFQNYLRIHVGINLCDILEVIQYASRFFILKFEYSEPVNASEGGNYKTFEEVLQIQTFNPNSIQTINAIVKRFGN